MRPVCAWVLTASVVLGAPPALAEGGPLAARPPAPTVLVLVAPKLPAEPAPRRRFVLTLSREIELAAGTLMKNLGAAGYYRVAPGLAWGAGASVTRIELPTGRLRAFQILTVLRFNF